MAGINDFAALMPMFMRQWQAQQGQQGQQGQNTGNPLPDTPPPPGSVPELTPPKPAGIAPQISAATGAAPGTMASGSGIMDWLNGNTAQGFNRGMMLQGALAGIGAARPGTDPMSMFANMAQGAAAGGMQGVQNGWAAANQQQQAGLADQKGQIMQQQIDAGAMNNDALQKVIAQLQKGANPADPQGSAKTISDLILRHGNILGPYLQQGVQPATPKGMR